MRAAQGEHGQRVARRAEPLRPGRAELGERGVVEVVRRLERPPGPRVAVGQPASCRESARAVAPTSGTGGRHACRLSVTRNGAPGPQRAATPRSTASSGVDERAQQAAPRHQRRAPRSILVSSAGNCSTAAQTNSAFGSPPFAGFAAARARGPAHRVRRPASSPTTSVGPAARASARTCLPSPVPRSSDQAAVRRAQLRRRPRRRGPTRRLADHPAHAAVDPRLSRCDSSGTATARSGPRTPRRSSSPATPTSPRAPPASSPSARRAEPPQPLAGPVRITHQRRRRVVHSRRPGQLVLGPDRAGGDPAQPAAAARHLRHARRRRRGRSAARRSSPRCSRPTREVIVDVEPVPADAADVVLFAADHRAGDPPLRAELAAADLVVAEDDGSPRAAAGRVPRQRGTRAATLVVATATCPVRESSTASTAPTSKWSGCPPRWPRRPRRRRPVRSCSAPTGDAAELLRTTPAATRLVVGTTPDDLAGLLELAARRRGPTGATVAQDYVAAAARHGRRPVELPEQRPRLRLLRRGRTGEAPRPGRPGRDRRSARRRRLDQGRGQCASDPRRLGPPPRVRHRPHLAQQPPGLAVPQPRVPRLDR